MANVSFHVGTSAPGTSGLTTDGLYFNKSGGGIYYATSATARSEIASKVSVTRSYSTGRSIGSVSVNGSATSFYLGLNKNFTTCSASTLATISSSYSPSIVWCYCSGVTATNATKGYLTSGTMYAQFPMFRCASTGSSTYRGTIVSSIDNSKALYIAGVTWSASSGFVVNYEALTATDFCSGTISSGSTQSQAFDSTIRVYDYSNF